MAKRSTSIDATDNLESNVMMDPILRLFGKMKTRKKSRNTTQEGDDDAASPPAASGSGAKGDARPGGPSIHVNSSNTSRSAPGSGPTMPAKAVQEPPSVERTPGSDADFDTMPAHTISVEEDSENQKVHKEGDGKEKGENEAVKNEEKANEDEEEDEEVSTNQQEKDDEEYDEEENDEEEDDEEEKSAEERIEEEINKEEDGEKENEEEHILKPTDGTPPTPFDSLSLLWSGAYHDLSYEDVPKLAVIDRAFAPHSMRLRRSQSDWNTIDEDGEPTMRTLQEDKMRRYLDYRLAEPGLGDDWGDGNNNNNNEAFGLLELKSVVRQVALRESQRGATIAWIAVCLALERAESMSDEASNIMHQCILDISSAMEWYCRLPSALTGQPGNQDHTTTIAISALYEGVLLHLFRLAFIREKEIFELMGASEGEPEFPNNIIEKERAVIACFNQPHLISRLEHIKSSLKSKTQGTDTENSDLTKKASLPDTTLGSLRLPLYSLRDELPEAPKDHQGVRSKAYDWVKSTTEFERFMSTHANNSDRELWVTGKPGTGKSMLLQAIAQHLSRPQDLNHESKTEPVVKHVAAFFCNQGKDREENAAAIVQCLVSQVLDQQPQLHQLFSDAFTTTATDLFDRSEDLIAISTAFQAIINDDAFRSTCFIVDSIDECCSDGDELDTDATMSELMELIKNTRHLTGVRWLVSSTTYSSFDGVPDIYPKLELSLDEQSEASSSENSKTVLFNAAAENINLRVTELMRDMQLTDKSRSDIENKMFKQSKGNFLWVELACKQILSHGLPWDAISFLDPHRNPDEALPSGLEKLFAYMEATFARLQWNNPQYCREIIITLAAAYKPLQLCELSQFVLGDPDHGYPIPPNVDLSTLIAKQCFSFLEIRNGHIFFVHQSIKSFFRKKMGDAQRHSKMTECCLRVLPELLHESSRSNTKLTKPQPYAMWHWLKHLSNLSLVGTLEGNSSLLGKVTTFLRGHLFHWLEALSTSSSLAQALTQLVRFESILQKLCSKTNDALQECFDQVQFATRLLRFHQSTQSPAEIPPSNSLIFCPSLGTRRREFLRNELPWLSSTPAVEPFNSFVLDAHSDWVRSCAFSSDSRFLASASDDESVRIWNPLTGALKATLNQFDSWALRVRFSSGTPSRIATMDSTYLKVWGLAVARPILSVCRSDFITEPADDDMVDISFSPDGKRLAAIIGSDDSAICAIWDIENSGKNPRFHWKCPGATGVRYLLASNAPVTSKGGLLATSHESGSQSFVIRDEEGMIPPEGEGFATDIKDISALAFCQLSKRLAAGSATGDVRVWGVHPDGESNKIKELIIWRHLPSTGKRVTSLAFSGNGTLLGIASEQNKDVFIWNVDSGPDQNPRRIQTGHDRGPLEIAFTVDDSVLLLASCGHEGTVEIADVNATQPGLSHTSSENNTETLPVDHMHQSSVDKVVFAPNSRFLASYSEYDEIKLWDGDTGKFLRSLRVSDHVLSMFFSNDGAIFAGTFSGYIKIWNTISGKEMHNIHGHEDWIRGGAFWDKRLLATASDDRTVKVWDLDAKISEKDSQPTPYVPLQTFNRHADYVICVAFSPNGELLASAGDDGMVYIWDRTANSTESDNTSNYTPYKKYEFPSVRIYSVTFTPNGKHIVASASGGKLRMWNLETNDFSTTHHDRPFNSLQFSSADYANETWVLTEMGPKSVGESESSMSIIPMIDRCPQWAPWSIDSEMENIQCNGETRIFLPKHYRPANDAVFVQGSRVAIGCRSGLVMFFRFDETVDSLGR